MKKVLGLVGVVALAAVMAVPAAANNTATAVDSSTAVIAKLKSFTGYSSTVVDIHAAQTFLGYTNLAAVGSTGSIVGAGDEINDSSTTSGEVLLANQVETNANYVDETVTVTTEQCDCSEGEYAAYSNDAYAEDDSAVAISDEKIVEKSSAIVDVETAEQASAHEVYTAVAGATGNTVLAGDSITNFHDVTGVVGGANSVKGNYNWFSKVVSLWTKQ